MDGEGLDSERLRILRRGRGGLLCEGENSYCLLWSLPQALSNAEALAENGVEVVVMPYPSADGVPSLEYMLNGFCIFENGDEDKLQASRYLVDFLCNDETGGEGECGAKRSLPGARFHGRRL